jgi:hypothetical protein
MIAGRKVAVDIGVGGGRKEESEKGQWAAAFMIGHTAFISCYLTCDNSRHVANLKFSMQRLAG